MENNSVEFWTEKLNLSQKKLAEKLNFSEQTIVNWKNKGAIPDKYIPLLEKLLNNNSNNNYNNSVVNNGTNFGQMQYGTTGTLQEPTAEYKPHTTTCVDCKPIMPTQLYKQPNTNVREYIDENSTEIHYSPNVKQFARFNYWYECVGSSMQPYFLPSDVLALQRLEQPYTIINGDVYCVDTRIGVIVRMLYRDGEQLIGKAFNERFADIEIQFADIYDIYRVVGLVRKNI